MTTKGRESSGDSPLFPKEKTRGAEVVLRALGRFRVGEHGFHAC